VQTGDSGSLGGIRSSDPVVSNRQVQIPAPGVSANVDHRCLRMFGRIRHRLGDDMVCGHLYRVR
jgi:hypothetical protein